MNSTLTARLRADARLQPLLWLVLVLGVAAWGWLRLGSAQRDHDQALSHHLTVNRDVERIVELRNRTVDLGNGPRQDVDLISRAQRALAAVGLPASACSGVQPRSDQAGATGKLRVQTVELLLQGLTPGELGAWLGAWRSANQAWQVSELMLNHLATLPGQDPIGLDSNRFQASVLLSAPYLDSP